MAEKDSFVFYRSFFTAIDRLPTEAQAEVYRAIALYGLDHSEPANLSPVAAIMWDLIKPQLDANWKRFENGKKGGAPRGNSNARKYPKTTEKQPKNNLKQPNVNDNVNVKENANANVVVDTSTTMEQQQMLLQPPLPTTITQDKAEEAMEALLADPQSVQFLTSRTQMTLAAIRTEAKAFLMLASYDNRTWTNSRKMCMNFAFWLDKRMEKQKRLNHGTDKQAAEAERQSAIDAARAGLMAGVCQDHR